MSNGGMLSSKPSEFPGIKSQGSHANVSAIAGGIAGGTCGLLAIIALLWLIRRRSLRCGNKSMKAEFAAYATWTHTISYDYARDKYRSCATRGAYNPSPLESGSVGRVPAHREREGFEIHHQSMYLDLGQASEFPRSSSNASTFDQALLQPATSISHNIPERNSNISMAPYHTSPSEVLELRREIALLRRMMQFFRTDAETFDAPPSYREDDRES